MKKRILAMVLAGVMVLSMAACGNKTEKTVDTGAVSKEEVVTDEASEDASNPYKLSEEKETLKVYMSIDEERRSILNNEINNAPTVQKLEELTNVHIEFITQPAGDDGSFFNLLLMEPTEWPDIFIHDFSVEYEGGILQAIEDGIIINHTDLLNEYGPNILEMAEVNKELYNTDLRILENGMLNIFEYPEPSLQKKVGYGTVMRKDWLDQCGLEIPTTFEEFEVACETIMATIPSAKYGMAVAGINSWWVGNQSFYTAGYDFPNNWIEPMIGPDGNVVATPMTEGYGEWLEMMARWSTKGIWHSDNWTFDEDACFNALVTGQAVATTLGMWQLDQQTELGKANDPNFEIVAVPILRKAGDASIKGYTELMESGRVGFGNYYISAESDKQELAMSWINVLHNQEIIELMALGKGILIEGQEPWKIDEETGLLTYADWLVNHTNENGENDFNSVVGSYSVQKLALAYPDGQTLTKSDLYNDSMEIWTTGVDGSKLLDNKLVLSVEDNDIASPIYENLNSILKEYVRAIILGEKPVSEWETAVKLMEDAGVQEWVDIYQGAYESQMK